MLSLDFSLTQEAFTLSVAKDIHLSGVTAVFGPSGAGKSSLLRVIAGFEAQAQGRVTYDGALWQGDGVFIAPDQRGVGMVFQDARLFSHLNVAGNLRYADRRSKHIQSGINIDSVVQSLDLEGLLSRRTDALSGGERQRVAIARALLTRPRLMLLDEPLAALDLRRKADILPYIARLPQAFGVPVLYVTHSMDEVARIADQVIVLRDGQVVATGDVADTFARLDLDGGGSRFEAGVLLRATVQGYDEAWNLTRLDLGGQVLMMPDIHPRETGVGVQLRVRARDVMLATERPVGLSAQNILQGEITEVLEEADTAFAEVFLTVSGQQLRARITRAAVAQMALGVGVPAYAVLKAISFDRRML